MSQEMSDLLNRFVTEFVEKNIKQGAVGIIQSFNGSKMRADVDVLQKTQDDEEQTPVDFGVLPDLPVQFLYAGGSFIKPNYQKGDMVWITFATNDIDDSLKGIKTVDNDGEFNLAAASVSHGIAPEGWTPPANFNKTGLVIGDDQVYLQVDGGEIRINGANDNAVRHTALDVGLQTFITDLNLKLVTALTAAGSSWPGTSLDISGAKITEVKTS